MHVCNQEHTDMNPHRTDQVSYPPHSTYRGEGGLTRRQLLISAAVVPVAFAALPALADQEIELVMLDGWVLRASDLQKA
ncbi:hypothetical protein [Aquibium oceanicum]|uniref:Uncharacterized protein n=1 Tax=Aquibium oceanicum TaxID=1670800 RepID=A0A1L3SVB7_9HYPH|nr:hypothetical protein [Aquibium oceanicum]APH73367.1 hypothetical protein BSQ44_19790 [Aquibium oceanicum]